MFSNLVSIVRGRGQAKHRDVDDPYGVLVKNLYSEEKYQMAVEELLVLVRERDDILAVKNF